jgi:hypothetical protein
MKEGREGGREEGLVGGTRAGLLFPCYWARKGTAPPAGRPSHSPSLPPPLPPYFPSVSLASDTHGV